MVHLVFSGRGFLVPVVTFASCLGMELTTRAVFQDDSYYQERCWPIPLALAIAGVVCVVVGQVFSGGEPRTLVDVETREQIVVPYVLTLKHGEQVQADLLVKDFGPMLVATEAAAETFRRLGDQIATEGYGYSMFCGEELPYDREHFIEILTDWGWTGAEDRRPAWSK